MSSKLKLIFIIILTIFNPIFASVNKEKNLVNEQIIISQLNWIEDKNINKKSNLIWKQSSEKGNTKFNSQYLINNQRIYDSNFYIRSIGKSVEIDNKLYPDISNYVPNGFVESGRKTFTTSFRGISQTRHCDPKLSSCHDGVLDLDFNLINLENFSFNPKINIQSLSNRGTKFGEGVSLGFKAAKNISPEWSVAFGGENIIHLDNTVDLGRNFYLVASSHIPFSRKKEDSESFIFINAGIGSDFFGYKGNGFLGTTSCLGKPNLTGGGSENCNWGPIGSIAFVFNERFSLINEWFGYSYGSGFSYRPLKDSSMVFSFFATDFIEGFPSYASEGCPNNECSVRFYGSISLSI